MLKKQPAKKTLTFSPLGKNQSFQDVDKSFNAIMLAQYGDYISLPSLLGDVFIAADLCVYNLTEKDTEALIIHATTLCRSIRAIQNSDSGECAFKKTDWYQNQVSKLLDTMLEFAQTWTDRGKGKIARSVLS